VSAVLRLTGITKSYDDLDVLRGVDFEVIAGSRVAVIGPSGSGKSTLLRLIMGLERPTSGQVEILGEELWHEHRGGRRRPARGRHVRRVRRHVGMVFQHFHLFPHMDVLRNVTEAPVRVAGLSRVEARARALALLDAVGLADKAGARPSELSGGQKQRVGIARALAMEPAVLLLDEVTSALDPELVGEVLGVLRGVVAERATTIVLVTHQMRFAAEIADRVVFMDHGVVVEDAAPDVIFQAPREARTREFLDAVLGAEAGDDARN
jgi:polar amino acid transport system ATP-binding protein